MQEGRKDMYVFIHVYVYVYICRRGARLWRLATYST